MIDPNNPQDYHEAMCVIDDLKRERDAALAECEKLRVELAQAQDTITDEEEEIDSMWELVYNLDQD